MKICLEKSIYEAFAADYPIFEHLASQLKFSSQVELSSAALEFCHIEFLTALYRKAGLSESNSALHLGVLEQAFKVKRYQYKEGELEHFFQGLIDYLIDDVIYGWLFLTNPSNKPLAYLISRVDYTPPGEEETGRVLVELKANAMAKIASKTIAIRERDIVSKTVPQVLSGFGYFKETPSLIESYQNATNRFYKWRAKYGCQFSGSGTGIFAEDPTASHRTTDWSRKSNVVLSSSGGVARLVNDEAILSERALVLDSTGNILSKYLRKAARSTNYNEDVERAVEQAQDSMPDKVFIDLPVHGYILMFHLELHHHLWVHVDDMKPYMYQPQLKQKLILPPEQTDLIDILTAEMDLLMEDIIEGKSGGTTVLCAGPAGVGKTLTAEVYAEIIHRPLYRVHSGQLGVYVKEMEQALKETLTRAQRWGAVMLIDEADVYIKRREDNLAANAVVGVFLRVLEYFNGLLFLTTNRVDDIDEAIISRCIALIKYRPPCLSDRRKIWYVMTQQFSIPVSDDLLEKLPGMFPDASGRDIKGLAKLVSK